MKNFKIKSVLSSFVLLGCLIYVLYLRYNILFENPKLDKEFAENYYIVKGEFDRIQRAEWAAREPSTYRYKVDGELVICEFDRNVPCRDSDLDDEVKRNEIIKFEFPVAVHRYDSGRSMSLIRKQDFLRIGLNRPDSMQSICMKYFDCTWWEQVRADD